MVASVGAAEAPRDGGVRSDAARDRRSRQTLDLLRSPSTARLRAGGSPRCWSSAEGRREGDLLQAERIIIAVKRRRFWRPTGVVRDFRETMR